MGWNIGVCVEEGGRVETDRQTKTQQETEEDG